MLAFHTECTQTSGVVREKARSWVHCVRVPRRGPGPLPETPGHGRAGHMHNTEHTKRAHRALLLPRTKPQWAHNVRARTVSHESHPFSARDRATRAHMGAFRAKTHVECQAGRAYARRLSLPVASARCRRPIYGCPRARAHESRPLRDRNRTTRPHMGAKLAKHAKSAKPAKPNPHRIDLATARRVR